jgi:hypothetical protein
MQLGDGTVVLPHVRVLLAELIELLLECFEDLLLVSLAVEELDELRLHDLELSCVGRTSSSQPLQRLRHRPNKRLLRRLPHIVQHNRLLVRDVGWLRFKERLLLLLVLIDHKHELLFLLLPLSSLEDGRLLGRLGVFKLTTLVVAFELETLDVLLVEEVQVVFDPGADGLDVLRGVELDEDSVIPAPELV